MQQKDTGSLREARRLETRALIQEAARRLIVEHGYEKTTMRMLAREAGVGLGTIGLHFKDKQSLLLASFFDEIGALSMKALDEARQLGSVRVQLLAVVETLYRYYASNTGYLRAVVREALFVRGEWRARFDAQLGGMVAQAAQFFEEARKRGEIRADVDGMQAAYACWSLYLSLLIDGLNAEVFDVETLKARFEGLLDLLLAGMETGETRG